MKVRLLRDARIRHAAGEVVEVRDLPELQFLVTTGSATVLGTEAPRTPEAEAEPETRTAKKTARKK